MNFNLFPWENNVKPVLVNDDGYEWYIEKQMTQYARRGKGALSNVTCFYVRKGKMLTRVLINDKKEQLFDTPSMEKMGQHIDMLKLLNL